VSRFRAIELQQAAVYGVSITTREISDVRATRIFDVFAHQNIYLEFFGFNRKILCKKFINEIADFAGRTRAHCSNEIAAVLNV